MFYLNVINYWIAWNLLLITYECVINIIFILKKQNINKPRKLLMLQITNKNQMTTIEFFRLQPLQDLQK